MNSTNVSSTITKVLSDPGLTRVNINSHDVSSTHLLQLDGNMTILSDDSSDIISLSGQDTISTSENPNTIPVIVGLTSRTRHTPEPRIPTSRTIRRNNKVVKAANLPIVV